MVRIGRRLKPEGGYGVEWGLKEARFGAAQKSVMSNVGVVESEIGDAIETEGGTCHFICTP